MKYITIDEKDKPEKWPANAIESQLENIQNQLNKFLDNPSYRNKEVLISLVADYDLNQRNLLGLIRTTDYEVTAINSIFLQASVYQINILKVYLYELISYKTRMQKMLSWIPEMNSSVEIEPFEKLFPQLKLHYFVYQSFTIENKRSYAEHLIEIVESVISEFPSDGTRQAVISNITRDYISLLNDISNFRCVKRTRIWAFSRDEIYKLYQLAAKLIEMNSDTPTQRPLKGVLMMSISNYILKSRNNYSEDYICKYISPEVAKQSIDNHQIWIKVIEKLNDEREQKVIPELFDDTSWTGFSWAKNIDFIPKRKYYVSSFCKKINDPYMKKNYGECVYGYKDDRMAEILAPIRLLKINGNEKIPQFSQVIAFDVIYDKEEAKEELKYLCKIIDCFDLSNDTKKTFLEEILQYWILSVKDSKWADEKERRYVLFMYDEYEYNEIDLHDSNFLKLKTSLFIEPDFILGNNPVKDYIRKMIDEKRKAISMKPYMFCFNCFNRDFDISADRKKVDKCSICGSKDICFEEPSKAKK